VAGAVAALRGFLTRSGTAPAGGGIDALTGARRGGVAALA